jgi:hypothetical protein
MQIQSGRTVPLMRMKTAAVDGAVHSLLIMQVHRYRPWLSEWGHLPEPAWLLQVNFKFVSGKKVKPFLLVRRANTNKGWRRGTQQGAILYVIDGPYRVPFPYSYHH